MPIRYFRDIELDFNFLHCVPIFRWYFSGITLCSVSEHESKRKKVYPRTLSLWIHKISITVDIAAICLCVFSLSLEAIWAPELMCRVYIDKTSRRACNASTMARSFSLSYLLTSTQSQFYFSFFNVRIYLQLHPSSWVIHARYESETKAWAKESSRRALKTRIIGTFASMENETVSITATYTIRITSICYGITITKSSFLGCGILIPHFIPSRSHRNYKTHTLEDVS